MRYEPEFMERFGVVPLREDAGVVVAAVAAPQDARLRRSLESYHGKAIRFRIVDERELAVLMQRAAAGATNDAGAAADPNGVAISGIHGRAPAVDLVNAILNDAIARGASDVHLVSSHAGVSVRYRVDGRLRDAQRFETGGLASGVFPSVSARLKVLARLNASERRRPQDGSFTARLSTDTFDVRLSAVPTIEGESIVLRLFPQTRDAYRLEHLGMPEGVLEHVLRFVSRPAGLLLICGPTGSGKTTTLHAALASIANGHRKIVTIEDPVEYRLERVEQIQTNDATGLTFDALLRSVLRQDPDVVMVGEIRDRATARLSVRAALTGHLVLATVHGRNTGDARRRIVDLGVERRLFDALGATAIAQRLVRTRCTCGLEHGCDRCYHTGLRGRTGIFALDSPDGSSFAMRDDAAGKVVGGLTTEREVAWAIDE